MSDYPLVTFVVFAYMQQEYIREAVLSAFAQSYHPLEILITDDCSSDDTFTIIKDAVNDYQGNHSVIINRNETNMGLAESINRAWDMTHGEFIVVQGGDDISMPERTTELVERWLSGDPRPDLVFSNVIFMNSDGATIKTQTEPCQVPSLDEIIDGRFFIAGGMAAAYSRSIIDQTKRLNHRVVFEDNVLTFRALFGNGIVHVASPLVRYRSHGSSIMANSDWDVLDRKAAQKRALHMPAEREDRLQTWMRSGKSDLKFTWQLKRAFAGAKLEACSCNGSRGTALLCCLWALVTIRPRMAWIFFIRDVLRR